MPQMDSLSFFNQIFWLVVIFLVFYGLCLTVALPVLAKVLKARYKLLNSLSGSSDSVSFSSDTKREFFSSFNSVTSFFTLVFPSFSLKAGFFKKAFNSLYLTFARNLVL